MDYGAGKRIGANWRQGEAPQGDEGPSMLTATTPINRRDLDFLLEDWLALGELLRRPRYAEHDSETVKGVLDLAEQVAEREFAPHLRASDTIEPSFNGEGDVVIHPAVKAAVRQAAESGLFSAVFDAELGGLQLPFLIHFAAMGVLMGGSLPAASFQLLTVGNARLIANFGSPRQIEAFAMPSVAGRSFGTMCMSEPHAGSSLGDITTRATHEGDDEFGQRFRLQGSKMWISAADHDAADNIVHLVLAKAPGPDGRVATGTRGISLFIVPKVLPSGERNDIQVIGLNHKLGFRGIPNCAVNFGSGAHTPGDREGAVGWLVGAIGDGLPQMFQMMNEARISVGLGAAMLAYRGYLLSVLYATERRQGRLPEARGGGQVAIVEHADVKRMLLAEKAVAEGALALILYAARLLDDEQTAPEAEARAEASTLLALLTPVAKTWPSELAQEALHNAIQIHGGAGYTRDFLVEQLYRDNRLNPIHEGTTGIQAIDLVNRKIRRDHGGSFALAGRRVAATLAATGPALAPEAAAVRDAWRQVEIRVEALIAERDEARAIANATPFLFAFGHAVLGWLWLDVANVAERKLGFAPDAASRAFLDGKIRAARYFARFELPRVAAWLAPGDDLTAAQARAEEFYAD